MAESVVKIRIDSQEYDAKLKKAGEALNKYFDTVKKGGGTLEQLDDGVLEAVQSIGKMETASNSARGRIGEMTKAFTELQFRYQQFTDAEKQAPIGKEMAKSLETLKGRIRDDKEQLDDINKSISGSGGLSGAIDNLTGKLGVSIQSLVGWGTAISAAKVALDVAKDAFFNNEEQLDEWGRVVESSHSLYSGFLNALNTGDISGYLSNINNIVQAARDAYDALDALGTYNAFNQINVERTRTNMTESIADYRGGQGTKEAVKAAGEAYKKELQDRKRLENEAYLAAVKRMASERGINAKDLQDALSGTYGHYQDLKNVMPTGVRQTVVGAGMFARTGTETFAQTRQEKLGEALRHLNDTELQSLQALGAQAQRTGNEIAQVDKQLTRVVNGRGGAGGTTTTTGGGGGKGGNTYIPVVGSIDAQAEKVEKLRKAWRAAADDDSRQKLKKEIEAAQFALDIMMGKTSGIPAMNYGVENLAGKNGSGVYQDKYEVAQYDKNNPWKLDDKTIKSVAEYYDKKTEKTTASLTKEVGNIASGIGGIFNGIESLGVELPQGMKDVLNGIQGVVSILTSISTIVTAIQALTAADTIIPFSRGGVVRAASGYTVPGNYGYDAVPALLSSGEVVLNRAQTSNLASQLSDNGGGGRGYTPSHVSGEQIWIALNAFTRRTGKGELVTWR